MRSLHFALVGEPVAHSMSPRMHAAAFRALGLPHDYEAVPTSAEALAARVAALRAGRYDGLNVTVPHKVRVLPLLDVLAPSARFAGAVNTVVKSPEGALVGHNTDAPALAAELAQLGPDVATDATARRGLVLGSGGAARAAVAALALGLGVAEIGIRARALDDPAAAEDFLAELRALLAEAGAPTQLFVEPFVASPSAEPSVSVVIQATSAGMHGASPGEVARRVVSWEHLPARAIARDVVYNPATTPFLDAARKRSLRCACGLGMLARQGALALELWLGLAAPVDAMRAALE